MKVNVKALSSFIHGRVDVTKGDSLSFGKLEAEDLAKNGLVEITGDSEQESNAETEHKMAEPLENKMLDTPANKSRAKKQ